MEIHPPPSQILACRRLEDDNHGNPRCHPLRPPICRRRSRHRQSSLALGADNYLDRGRAMTFDWKPHYIFPTELSHTSANGCSVIRANTDEGETLLSGRRYEVLSPDDGIRRFEIGRASCRERVCQYV